MPPPPDLRATLLAAWRTNNRVTVSLVEHLPSALWDIVVPGAPRRTIRAIAAHLHNARCMWVKTLGREHGIPAPLRDAAYDAFARHRYRWFGKLESCRMPTPALRQRFVDVAVTGENPDPW